MKKQSKQMSNSQMFPVRNNIEPDHGQAMGRTIECEIITDLDEKLARLLEIMQADHDASQLEQYLLEFDLVLS